MNKWLIYIPIGMSSHMSKSVFPINGARFAVEKKCIKKTDKKTASKDTKLNKK